MLQLLAKQLWPETRMRLGATIYTGGAIQEERARQAQDETVDETQHETDDENEAPCCADWAFLLPLLSKYRKRLNCQTAA